MGQAISSAIKAVTGDSKDDSKTRDTLNALQALGQSRSDFVIVKVNSNAESHYAPVSKILFEKRKIICNTKTDTTEIVAGIKEGFENLITGQMLDGITGIVAQGLKAILGEYAGQIAMETTYALIATDLAALLRIDVDTYNFQTTTAIGLQSTINCVTAVTMVISSVDVQSMTPNDLRAVVSLNYSSSSMEVQKQILAALIAAYNEEKKGRAGNLSGDSLLEYRKLFVPSVYEAELNRRLREGPPLRSALDDEIVTKASLNLLERRLREHLSVRPSISNDNGYVDGYHSENSPSGNDGSLSGNSISLVIPVSRLNDRENWANRMSSLLAAFVPLGGTIKYRGVPTKIHGTSVTFDFSIEGSVEQFNTAVTFFERVLIPKLGECGQLVADCHSFLLEYSRPHDITSTASFPRQFKLGSNGANEASDLNFYPRSIPSYPVVDKRMKHNGVSPLKNNMIEFNEVTVINLSGRACWFFDESGSTLLRFSETEKEGLLDGTVSSLSPNGTAEYRTNWKSPGPQRGARILLHATGTGTGTFPMAFILQWEVREEGESKKVEAIYSNPS